MHISLNLTGINQFKSTNIDKIQSFLHGKNDLGPSISLCHICHSHVPAWRYHHDGKVYLAKNCVLHGISNHLIEKDYEFYKGLNYTQDNPQFNFNGGILVETTDRCNLECPHCYHEPNNDNKDQSIDTFLKRIETYPRGPNEINRIILAGAESTLRPDFFELIREIRNHYNDVDVSAMTNGIKFSDQRFASKAKHAGLAAINIGLNHPTYIGHKVIRQKQEKAIKNAHIEDIKISYISYTMNNFSELNDILSEIVSNNWQAKNFRIRYGSNIGRRPDQERVFVSDIYKSVKNWCLHNDISFKLINFADNNIYHVMVNVDNKILRLIQWCDETDIDMEELRSGPWCDFVPDGITNFLHQIIRRDLWKNNNIILPDSPPDRYIFNRKIEKNPLNLYNLTFSSNYHKS